MKLASIFAFFSLSSVVKAWFSFFTPMVADIVIAVTLSATGMFAALYIEDRDMNPGTPFKLSNFLSDKKTGEKEQEASTKGPEVVTEDKDVKKVFEEVTAKAKAEAGKMKEEEKEEEEEDFGNFKTTPEEEK